MQLFKFYNTKSVASFEFMVYNIIVMRFKYFYYQLSALADRNEVHMDFNVRLKALRQKHKLTQSELADILGLKPTAISNYESKRNEPSFEKLIALSKYFDVSCDYLLGVSDSYLPIGGEVLDKDIVDFFNSYQQLRGTSSAEIRKYMDYLLYLQSKESGGKD